MHQSMAATIGLDVGDKRSQVCILDPMSGEVVEESRIRTTQVALRRYFANREPAMVALEVGTHSPWVSRILKESGHAVTIANARRVRLIHGSNRKNDRLDAEKLARLTRLDSRLLSPIEHRSAKAQADLARIRSRDALVRTRSSLIVHVRGSVKAFGERLPTGSSATFHTRACEHLPTDLRAALIPVISVIKNLTQKIQEIEAEIEALAKRDYPITELLQQVVGVGTLTALTFQLVLEDPHRFSKSREVGPYLGLTPGQRQSGDRNPKQRITKEGDALLRRLLVQCAHQVLHSKKDTDIKRAALRIMSNGAHRAVAITAAARKLAVLLHHLWITGEKYQPLYNGGTAQGAGVIPA